MAKIKVITSIISVFFITTICAQSKFGVDYYRLGEYEKAKKYFNDELNQNPAESNFFLGEIAFAEGDFKKAEEYYTKGLGSNPESVHNQIGLAKLGLKTDAKAAENTLNSIAKKNKKDVDVALTIGYAYLNNGMYSQAQKKVDDAKKINEKNPEIYVLEGDIIVAGNSDKKSGEAAGKYEMSTYFDPDFVLGYVKTAQFYENINASLSIEKLKAVIDDQPDYIIAYGYLGKIYTQNGFYPQAIEMYKTYFGSSSVYSVEDIERYARALYFTENYADAKKLVQEGLSISPDYFVLNRYLMYIDAKTKHVEEGLNAARKFFSLRDDSGYISQDYANYALILSNAKRYEEALSEYEKSISMEPSKIEFYTDAAATAREKKDYALAADYQKRMMAKKAELFGEPDYADDVIDVSSLGYDYYSAGVSIPKEVPLANELMQNKDVVNQLLAGNQGLNKDSLQNNVNYFIREYAAFYLNKADSVFDILIERVPDSYTGYRFKALTKHAINSNTEVGLARPYYEKVAEIITGKDEMSSSDRRILLEAYNYLGYHYYMKDDKPNTILYWNKVLEIDPQNKNAKLILEDINK